MASQPQNQEQDWRKVEFKYDRFFFEITFGIALVIVAVFIGFVVFPDDRGFQGNLYTTIIGVLITIFVLDRRAERREEQRTLQREKEKQAEALEQEKVQLIRQMGSRINEQAIRAAEELRAHGWINDGSLIAVQLRSANLRGARLRTANLERAILFDASLQGANLTYGNLRGSYMGGVNLREAQLDYADFQSAFLAETEFNAARLREANLEGAVLDFSQFDQFTLLPDGTNWTSDTDLRRFTDPQHPNFWRSNDPDSPAYRGKPTPE